MRVVAKVSTQFAYLQTQLGLFQKLLQLTTRSVHLFKLNVRRINLYNG